MSTSLQIPPSRQIAVPTPPLYAELDEQPHDEFSSFWDVLRRRRRTFWTIFISFFALVVLITLVVPKTYLTTVKLISAGYNPNGTFTTTAQNDTGLPILNALLGQGNGRSPETYVELLTEVPIAQRVVNDLHLNTSPGKLLGAIKAKPVTNTSIVELDVTWRNPTTSAAIANDFANVFVSRERDLIAGQADTALGFISSALPKAQAAQTAAEAELARFEAAHPEAYAESANQAGQSGTQVANVTTKIAQLQVDQGQATAALGELSGQLGSMSPLQSAGQQVGANPVLTALQQQLATVNVQLKAAQQQYTDQHPTVVGLKQQQQQLQREIAAIPATVVNTTNTGPNPTYQALDTQAAQLRAQIASDQSQLTSLKMQQSRLIAALPLQSQQLADLQSKAKLSQDVVNGLQQRYNDATVAKASAISDVEITQPADPAQAQIKPNLLLNSVVGLVLGFLLAVGGVFAIEYLDNTYKDERDVTRDLPSLPVLASVPSLAQTNGKRAALPWLRSLTVDSFLQIVTALHYSSDKPLRTLAIASPLPGDGKSTLCLNLGAALAEASGPILLIDADLRRPTLHQALGLENESGLSDVLIGARDAFAEIRGTKYHGLDFMPAGPKVPTPLKLLQSERFEKMLEQLLERYRMIVFDTPPVLSVFDCALVSARVDGTVLVLAAGKTDSRSTKRAVKRLTSVGNPNLLGIILNRATPEAKEYGYYRVARPPMVIGDAGVEP